MKRVANRKRSIVPLFEKYDRKPRKGSDEDFVGYWNRRKHMCKVNISSFYTHLTQTIFGGEILENGRPYQDDGLFDSPDSEENYFKPDLIVEAGPTRRIVEEVKASTIQVGAVGVGFH